MRTLKKQFFFFLLFLFLGNGTFLFAQDFGDAPDPAYPTWMANDGARHLVSLLYLGSRIDNDGDGMPGIGANGDDNSGGIDDEDGVVFTSWMVPGQSANIQVTTTGSGMLDAWIDFNANGFWGDAGEQIFASQALSAGPNALVFSVPGFAVSGAHAYARFRYSSFGGLLPSGLASDGEVEDYEVVFGQPFAGCIIMDSDPGLSNTQNEISMTTDAGSGNLIAAYNDQPYPGGSGLGISYSADNGVTWNALQLSIPMNSIAGVPMMDAFDPSITSDLSGNIYAAHIATDCNWSSGPVSGLYVHKSTNGGVTWGSPVTVDIKPAAMGSPDPNYRLNDRCQITCDRNSSSPFYQNVYLSWIQDRGWNMPQPYGDIYFSYSTNGGSSFSSAVMINTLSNNMGNMPVPAVAANGDVYVLWMNYNVITGGNGIMMLDRSTDGGITWGADVIVDTILLPPLYLNSGSDARAKGAAILRTDPVNPAILYIVYAADPDSAGPDECDIFFIRSVNSGSTFSNPLRVNSDITTVDQMMPWMEVKANGTIDIVWYDRRNDPGDLLWEVYAASSTDGGISFSANNLISCQSYPTPVTVSGKWMGEYLGLTIKDTMAYVGYTSSFIDVEGDVFFTSFSNPIVTSIGDVQRDSQLDLLVQPGLVGDIFQVQVVNAAQDEIFSLELYTLAGVLILSQTLTGSEKAEIDLSGLSPGIFILRVNDQYRTIARKIVKY